MKKKAATTQTLSFEKHDYQSKLQLRLQPVETEQPVKFPVTISSSYGKTDFLTFDPTLLSRRFTKH